MEAIHHAAMDAQVAVDFDEKPLDHDDSEPDKKDSEKTTDSSMALLQQKVDEIWA